MDEHSDYNDLNDEIRNDMPGELGDDLLNMDDDPIDYINFSDDEIIEEMPTHLGDDISNDLIDNIPNVVPLTPTKNSNILIEVGMEFSEQKGVVDLYTTCSKVKGFGIRIRTRRDNIVKLVCARQGHPPKKNDKDVAQVCQTKLKKTSSLRIGCEASVNAYKSENTKMWRITLFDDNHNHGLVTPKSVRYLRSHRKMSNAARSLVEHFSDASLPTGKVATIFRGDELSFDSRDCYNHLKSVRRRIYNTGDAQAVLNYCAKQQSLNPNFFYSIKCDDEDRMESFFWIDARSKKAYELFGDVITFDTTYRTNKYSMPFGPFVGVNNHLQSILFGCALLKDETEDTFIWLFKEWLRGMNGKHPSAIITDQYPKFSQTANIDFVCGTSQKSFQKIVSCLSAACHI
ncbi:protein FAR1-RELATED SEQUENCE 5-like isoform X2 [Gastrolobium bilobum]|uniref:protein FAR1-RELATED SEQUENCE 5-like isoform X2 n=1 Tax=Gastrolobium bilobum TaxID=150636 RepID=UPI002AB14F93|nr:protein FAR1-RELATED SEQUENCE 5-like isoform X2 [Gastrolobium bilobum]